MRHSTAIAFAIAQLVLAVKGDVDLDMDDVPTPCKTICQPIGTLSDRCDVDLRSDNDRDERLLQNQCICTNKSFNVAKVAALCADCMHQSVRPRRDDHADSDDLKDIDELMSVCGFASTTYSSAATSEVATIAVDVTRPTNVSQLTTTIDRNSPATGGGSGGSGATATSSGQSAQPTSAASRGTAPGTPVSSVTAAQTSGTQTSSASRTSTPTANAAPAATAQAVYAVGGLVAAAYLMV